MKKITNGIIQKFGIYLINEEKSRATVEKYMHDIRSFAFWLKSAALCKAKVLEYKDILIKKYAPSSVNSMISSLNAFFEYSRQNDLKMKTLKVQRHIFSDREHELTKHEYGRLLTAAENKKNKRLYYLLQTMASTGVRVSEIRHITCEAVICGRATIRCKGKIRQIFLPKKLCRILKRYIKSQNIKSGSVFISRSGNPLDRSNIWKMLKDLCESAGVSKGKVFPHNFRHLFARTFYSLQKDIVRLADVLGHSSIETTRLYTMESGTEHIKQLQKLGLLRC